MPKAKKSIIHHPFHRETIILAFILLFFSFILWLVFAKRLDDSTKVPLRGNLSATVFFSGAACNPQQKMKIPPCSGPYSNYLVKIFKKGNGVVASVLSDSDGKISLSLPAGEYYWLQNEKSISPAHPVSFVILPNQTITTEFIIDTGLR